ncbi:hypothetical protein KUCAC02_023917 [Chaenocephalus aceratus]|uniref:Uncharacterized protein n=1 Tax=Chaenocephalus aceratus TaxID=36190 RepID=A0ACB9WH36_CHAAC|nr:hypothetical protein KUCAC02_023917 [Chaenocephalus aceratus]
MVGPIDHLSPTSRFKTRSPEQGTRGRERDEVGWGNQLCVAIKLSFLSPSNGLPFPWFWGTVVLLVGVRPNRGGWEGGVSDRQESETKTLILLCLLLHQWMPSDVDRTQ